MVTTEANATQGSGSAAPLGVTRLRVQPTETILSVGIDVGTSTTQMVFSRLTVENTASAFAVPRISIIDKEIIYRSQIYITPLINPVTIDADALRTIVVDEYASAGLRPSDLGTGAAIITGETARAENAEQVLAALSELAGDFVVSTAGPHLESVLAARGAGLDTYSETTSAVVANLDIGGGTTNIAAYRLGQLLATSCLDIGGRLVRIVDGKISYISAQMQRLSKDAGISLRVGDGADVSKLRSLTRVMARHLAMSINLVNRDAIHDSLYTNAGRPLPASVVPTDISFSGGVADLIGVPEPNDPFRYGDIGVLLGRSITEDSAFSLISQHRGTETIGATVVGAGVHTTELSGSTIEFAMAALPLRNVPIITLPEELEERPAELIAAIDGAIRSMNTEDPTDTVALSLTGNGLGSFAAVQRLAGAIVEGARIVLNGPHPLVVVLEADRAKALGQCMAVLRGRRDDVICIDSVQTGGGDYIDIGTPVGSGRAVPVVVKTLVFNDRHGGEQ